MQIVAIPSHQSSRENIQIKPLMVPPRINKLMRLKNASPLRPRKISGLLILGKNWLPTYTLVVTSKGNKKAMI